MGYVVGVDFCLGVRLSDGRNFEVVGIGAGMIEGRFGCFREWRDWPGREAGVGAGCLGQGGGEEGEGKKKEQSLQQSPQTKESGNEVWGRGRIS